jgi:hypothetical protein
MIVVAALSGVVGCSEMNAKSDQPSMSYSTGEYSRGYRDGMREAMQSLFDDHAGWAWLWIMDKQYEQGYERGWADGRRKVQLEQAQERTGSGPDAPIMNE